MRGPDGVEYPNHTRFIEVIPGSRLTYDHGGFEDRPPLFRVEVTFTESGEQTRMEMTMEFASPEAATEARKMIRQANGDSTWDRLAEYLELQNSGQDVFVISRSFDVDQDALYEAWTNPLHIMQWTPPTGFVGRYLSVEIRTGGQAFYEMSGNGVVLYGKANYLELVRPNHLVYTQVFSDRDGSISRHPLAPTWPETMKTTVVFSSEGPTRSRVTLQWEVFGPATPEERQMFSGAKAGMMMGWTGSFDKLEEYLKALA
jgi:uncharacterized protein YndB with AHSA1/START domain